MKTTTTQYNIIRAKKDLVNELIQKLENSWSGISQVIEELEEFKDNAQTNLDESIKNNIDTPERIIIKSEKLVDFYEDHLENIKYQAEILQGETQEAIDHFESLLDLQEDR